MNEAVLPKQLGKKGKPLEISCEKCMHEEVCMMWARNPMAPGNAEHCAHYETVKGSVAYLIGFLDGKEANDKRKCGKCHFVWRFREHEFKFCPLCGEKVEEVKQNG